MVLLTSGSVYYQLKKLCKNAEIVQNYKDEARKYILDKYNWDNVLDKTLNLYFM